MTTLAYQPPANERLLWGCVAVSLLLHAMLMWRMHGVEPAAPMVQEFKATIRTQAPPAARPVPEPPKPEPTPEPPKPLAPPEPVPPPKPAVPLTPAIAPKVPPAEHKAAPVAPSTPQPATPALTPTPAAPTSPDSKSDAKADASKAAPTPAAATSAAAPSANSDMKALIQSYQLQLAQAAQKYKLYPAEARDQGWEGTAQIMIHVGADGRIAGIDLVNSTGHDLLDEQAKKTAQKAKPFVQIPAELRGQAFDAQIRVVFTLKQ